MTYAERVIGTFVASGKRCEAVLVLDCVDAVAAAGEDLVRIALVADVPYEAIGRRVEEIMQGDGQLDHAKARAEVTATACDLFDQVFAQLARDRGQLARVELAQVGGRVDVGKARIARGVDHGGVCGRSAIFGHAGSLGKDCGAGMAAAGRIQSLASGPRRPSVLRIVWRMRMCRSASRVSFRRRECAVTRSPRVSTPTSLVGASRFATITLPTLCSTMWSAASRRE